MNPMEILVKINFNLLYSLPRLTTRLFKFLAFVRSISTTVTTDCLLLVAKSVSTDVCHPNESSWVAYGAKAYRVFSEVHPK